MAPFAIYFPQFYPIATNDAAWGKGFTDWSLVANANLHDAWQRRAPEMGFYDGASPCVHTAQVAQARAAGLGGFAVYHYWFFTHQELGAFEQTLLRERRGIGWPWFLVWASESWSRRWVGDPTTLVNLSSEPTADEIRLHAAYLAGCFAHPDYLRIDGRPLFAWYQLGHFKRPAEVLQAYRSCWAALGHDVHVAQFVKKPFDAAHAPLVDSNYLFEPRLHFAFQGQGGGEGKKRMFDVARGVLGEQRVNRLLVWADRLAPRGKVYPAAGFLDYMGSPARRRLAASLGTVQDVLVPGWNNAPRYGARFTALEDLAPADFAELVRQRRGQAPIPLLVNAWNEWSEGAAIEPCAYLGRRYLDAMQQLEPTPTPSASIMSNPGKQPVTQET